MEKSISVRWGFLLFAVLWGASTSCARAKAESNADPLTAARQHEAALRGRLDSDEVYESAGQKFRVETIATYGDVVWGFDFLPDGRMIFTGRDKGSVNILDLHNGQITAVAGAPAVETPAQGGMLDVRVLPAGNGAPQIFLAYTSKVAGANVGTTLGRGMLVNDRLFEFHKIFAVAKGVASGNQFGARIEFDGNDHLFLTVGDHGQRDLAQQLDSHIGKILRLNLEGSAPTDNPFVHTPGAMKEIWSLGIRSPEGLTRHPVTGEIWEAEMGPKGGDEVNLIRGGANYGWPVICWGLEYSGEPVGRGLHEKEGMEQPVVYWNWSPEKHNLSPSAITFYTGNDFPAWKGNAFVGALSTKHIQRLVLNGDRVAEQEELLGDLNWRIRNLRMGPDGYLYLSTDSGEIARIVPAE